MTNLIIIIIAVVLAIIANLILLQNYYKNYIFTLFENTRSDLIKKKRKNIYLAVDINNIIVYSYEIPNEISNEFIGKSKEALQYITQRDDIELILYTCLPVKQIEKYVDFFKQNEINFKYINENPEINNNSLGCYDKKIFYDILIDNKSGFNAEKDWEILLKYIKSKNFNFYN